jgi:adenylate cyclase
VTLAPPQRRLKVCVIDDHPQLNQTLSRMLREQGYEAIPFPSADEFLRWYEKAGVELDLIISDISMPGMSGFELCRTLRNAQSKSARIPIVLITGGDPVGEKAKGLEAGADDFICKPFSPRELLAKVSSLLEIRIHDVETLRALNESRARNASLTSFVPSQIAELLTSDAESAALKPHRAEVSVIFFDLRRFTAFSEAAEPEEVLAVLSGLYEVIGDATIRHNATVGHLAGDGVMLFLNDPQPIAHHQAIAAKVATEVRDALVIKRRGWSERGYDIDFGIGIAEGYATIGILGFGRFRQYSIIGTVANLASRLCHVAEKGQILVSQRFLSRMGAEVCSAEQIGETVLKGIKGSVMVHNILSMNEESVSPSP